MQSVEQLQEEIKRWADEVYPHRTARTAMAKLALEELPELFLDPSSPGEYADCVILLLDIATLQGIDVGQAVRDKMAQNRMRRWSIDPETGLMYHVNDNGEVRRCHKKDG